MRYLAAEAFALCFDGALIPSDLSLPVARYTEDDSLFSEIASSVSFLPRIQLCGSNSQFAKEGKIGINRFAMVDNKEPIDLGSTFDCLPIIHRYKALRIGEGSVMNYYDPRSEAFKQIQVESEEQDSGCMFGPEFLLWVPSQKRFATFFFSSKSSRREAPALKTLMDSRRASTLTCKTVKGKKYVWVVPVPVPCSTPIELPELEEIKKEAESFANPKESEIEKVDTTDASNRER